LLKKIAPTSKVVARLDSVKRSVAWFRAHPAPDIVFMDIQLADGISFEIFEQCEVSAPVVFTTAYDAYAVKAFKVNSIDYILKPVDESDLEQAFRKYEALRGTRPSEGARNIEHAIQMLTRKYKTRFVTKVGEHLRAIEVSDVLYFLSQEKATFCHTGDGRRHIVDFTLDQLAELLDPEAFFRINRKYIVSVASIKDMVSYTNSRLKLRLTGSDDAGIVVARERVPAFRDWLDR
jgi:DNA-binding LytR/AlgR family response regulator